jgi:hypothetical protein
MRADAGDGDAGHQGNGGDDNAGEEPGVETTPA